MGAEKTLFDELGGRPTLERVHKLLYDKIYAHPWIGLYFASTNKALQERQQTDFMTGAMGGRPIYAGKSPADAHSHMYITSELFELRQSLLREALVEAGIAPEPRERWLALDRGYRNAIVKNSIDECRPRYRTESIVSFPNPAKRS